MFILDSLLVSGIRWALETTLAAAEAEMNDDTVLRERLLDAEMRREMGEITDEEFAEIEADVLGRIREIKDRREGGVGPLEAASDRRFQVEATVSGDFHDDPVNAPHTTIVETEPVEAHFLTTTESGETVRVLDMEPGDPDPVTPAARRTRSAVSKRTGSQRVAHPRAR